MRKWEEQERGSQKPSKGEVSGEEGPLPAPPESSHWRQGWLYARLWATGNEAFGAGPVLPVGRRLTDLLGPAQLEGLGGDGRARRGGSNVCRTPTAPTGH